MDSPNDNSKREQYLLMLFPTALVLAIYSVMFVIPEQKEKLLVEKTFLKHQENATTEESALLSMQNLKNETESLARLRKRVALSHQQVRELCAGWRSRSSRLETLEKITEMMQESNLSIVSQGQDNDMMVVSNYLKDLIQIIDEQTTQEPVEFWPIEIKGAYFDLVDFMMLVEQDAKSIIPVGITMKRNSEGSTQKTWTLLFVI